MISVTYATYPPFLNIDISVFSLNHILSTINATRLKF